MTKCPYVPPHEFDLDFPHVMLRYRAVEHKEGRVRWSRSELGKTDRNGNARAVSGAAGELGQQARQQADPAAARTVHRCRSQRRPAEIQQPHLRDARAAATRPRSTAALRASGRKAVLYATCFVNYNNPSIGEAMQAVLARNGVETEVVYPGCCRMPQLEAGDLAKVAEAAHQVATALGPYIDQGYDIVALVPSCALMFKFEWPLIVPDDPAVRKLSEATFDAAEYIVDIARNEGLAPGLEPLDGGVTLHIACHARAQNMGQKATEMLRLIPDTPVSVIERCSGHGGSWGVMKGNFETALKVGRPVFRQALRDPKPHLASECPLAAMHILQGMQTQAKDEPLPARPEHPIELLARAYGIAPGTEASAEPACEDAMNTPQSKTRRRLTRADILPLDEYAKIRRAAPRRDFRDQEAAAGRGRPVRDILFREFRHDVAAGPGDAVHREGRRSSDRRRTCGL